MIVFDIISIILLGVLLFWTVYNGSIIYLGIRNKRKIKVTLKEVENNPKFSLIIPTKNEDIVVKRCLDGILNMDYPKDKMEIIIVDGNSTDNTGKICSEYIDRYPQLFKFISEQASKAVGYG